MKSDLPNRRHSNFALVAYALILVLWGWYAYVTLTNHATASTQNNMAAAIRLTVVVPMLLIWLTAIHGAIRFREYVTAIDGSKDGRAMRTIATGLFFLVGYVVLLSVAGAIVNVLRSTPYIETAVALRNHLPIVSALISMILVYIGSQRLNGLVGTTTWTNQRILTVFLPFCAWAVIFSLLFYNRFSAYDANGLLRFSTSRDVLMFSYVLPHLVLWLLGIMAALNIAAYARKASGTLYKSAFRNLAVGVSVVLLATIIVQVVSTTSTILVKWPVAQLLLIVYALLALIGIGFYFVYRGARKLHQLEAV